MTEPNTPATPNGGDTPSPGDAQSPAPQQAFTSEQKGEALLSALLHVFQRIGQPMTTDGSWEFIWKAGTTGALRLTWMGEVEAQRRADEQAAERRARISLVEPFTPQPVIKP